LPKALNERNYWFRCDFIAAFMIGGWFDLFLVDNWMPELTGVELTQHIRAFNKITPIFFYSGGADEQDRQAALNAGAQGYLTKPAAIDDLIAEAERLRKHSM